MIKFLPSGDGKGRVQRYALHWHVSKAVTKIGWEPSCAFLWGSAACDHECDDETHGPWYQSRLTLTIIRNNIELIRTHRTILHGRRTMCPSDAGSELYHSRVYYLRLLYITDIIIMTPT